MKSRVPLEGQVSTQSSVSLMKGGLKGSMEGLGNMEVTGDI